jgi:hypothetical protein
MPRHVRQYCNVGTGCCGTGDEACPQRMSTERINIEAGALRTLLHHKPDAAAAQLILEG